MSYTNLVCLQFTKLHSDLYTTTHVTLSGKTRHITIFVKIEIRLCSHCSKFDANSLRYKAFCARTLELINLCSKDVATHTGILLRVSII